MRRLLLFIETALYTCLLADCFLLIGAAARSASYDPPGLGLIVILLVISGVRHLRSP